MPKLTMPETAARADNTVTLDSSPTMTMTSLYSAAIGPIGSDYYLPIFRRFEAAGQATLSWNWSACLYNLNWMIFRGLWGAALAAVGALLGAAVLLVALGKLVFDWPSDVLLALLLACLALFCLVPGAWGNALLYNHSRATIMTAVANNNTLTQACVELGQYASSRARFLRLLAVNGALAALAALAYVMLLGNDPPASPTPVLATALAPASSPASAASQAASAPAVPASVAASDAAPAAAAETASAATAAVSEAASTASELTPAIPASAPQATAMAASKPAAATAVAPVPGATRPEVAKPVVKASASKLPVKPVAKASAPAKPLAAAARPAKGFYVNAGLFANSDNAGHALAKLQAASLPAVALKLKTSQGPRTRVRVGPYVKRTQAVAAIRRIKGLKLDAALVKP